MYVLNDALTFNVSGGRRKLVGKVGGKVTVSRDKAWVKGKAGVKLKPTRKKPPKPMALGLFED